MIPTYLSPSAYDTGWIGRLHDILPDQAPLALAWLRDNQLPDGSWGNADFFHYWDRLICTISAVISLCQSGETRWSQQKAILFLERHLPLIKLSPLGATVGGELLLPALLHEAESMGLIKNGYTQDAIKQRQSRLNRWAMQRINRHTTMSHSLELLGPDVHMIDMDDVLEPDGSVAASPSATAYFLLNTPNQRYLEQGRTYLQRIVTEGTAPNVTPDIFQVAWTAWNRQVAGMTVEADALSFLYKVWQPGRGCGFASGYLPDGDDSSLVYDVLARAARPVDLAGVLHYQRPDGFRCFPVEGDPSTSTNIHVLGALAQAGLPLSHFAVQAALLFLQNTQHANGYWLDKWHLSPYYPSSHFIITTAGYYPTPMQAQAIRWIEHTQRPDGSWGIYDSTSEETAYCLQALSIWQQKGGKVGADTIKRGQHWLSQNQDKHLPLWVGKCLYIPYQVVDSAVMSGLHLAEQV